MLPRKRLQPSDRWLPLKQASCVFYVAEDTQIKRHDPRHPGHALMSRLVAKAYINVDQNDFDDLEWQSLGVGSARERWQKFYLPAFNYMVSTGAITLFYKEVQNGPFRQLAPEAWANLRVVDWNDGSAVDEETGRTLLMIHASITWGAKPGRKRKINLDKAKPFVLTFMEEMKIGAHPKRGELAAIERALSGYLDETVSESTVREFVKRLLAECRRQKAGN